jgi:hypothetical protein
VRKIWGFSIWGFSTRSECEIQASREYACYSVGVLRELARPVAPLVLRDALRGEGDQGVVENRLMERTNTLEVSLIFSTRSECSFTSSPLVLSVVFHFLLSFRV